MQESWPRAGMLRVRAIDHRIHMPVGAVVEGMSKGQKAMMARCLSTVRECLPSLIRLFLLFSVALN